MEGLEERLSKAQSVLHGAEWGLPARERGPEQVGQRVERVLLVAELLPKYMTSSVP
jgi:hypothetical protein